MIRNIAVIYVHGISTSRKPGWHLVDWHRRVSRIIDAEPSRIILHAFPVTWEQFNHDAKLSPIFDLVGDLAALRDAEVRDYIQEKLLSLDSFQEYWIVSHSLGTVLTQQALHRMPPETTRRFKHLTIGSPIARLCAAGIIPHRIAHKPVTVTQWANLHSRIDPVCRSFIRWTNGSIKHATINLPTWSFHAAASYNRSANFIRAMQFLARSN